MTNWSLIGGDPAPGDPVKLKWRCGHLDRTVDALEEVSREISKISSGTNEASWQGKAAEAMRDTLSTYEADLRPITDSFSVVASVLRSHAHELEQLQIRAKRALAKAELAKTNENRAETSLTRAKSTLAAQRNSLQSSTTAEQSHYQRSLADVALNDPQLAASNAARAQELAQRSRSLRGQVVEADHSRRTAQGQLDAARADLATERRTRADIYSEWDSISKSTARQVDDALVDSLRNKSNLAKLWGKAGDFVESTVQLFVDIADFVRNPSWESFRKALTAIGTLLSYAAIIVAIVAAPFTGGATLGIVAVIAKASLIVAILKTVSTVVLLSRGSKSVTPGDLVLDVIGVATAGKASGVASRNLTDFRMASAMSKQIYTQFARRSVASAAGNHIKKEILGYPKKYVKGKAYDALKEGVNGAVAFGGKMIQRRAQVPTFCLPPVIPPFVRPPVIRIPPLRLDIDLRIDVNVKVGV